MRKKIQFWHASLTEKQKISEQKQAEIIQNLTKKKVQQLAHLTALQTKQAILPDVIDRAKEQLKKNCVGEQGKPFLARVIKEIGGK